nr:molybdenum formylmethanofuran dehydrogenase [Candidatus Undinarchaeales archaeon ERR594346 U_76725]
ESNEGTITVNGNAGKRVGHDNYGTITVTGTIEELHKYASGTIIAGDVTEDHGIPWTKIT